MLANVKLEDPDDNDLALLNPNNGRDSVGVESDSDSEPLPEYNVDTVRTRVLEIVDDVHKTAKRLMPLGSNIRRDLLLEEIQSLQAKGRPADTIIAFCGGTGAGKSSLINALLGDNIVPTSGMAACTAVVTEIHYKPGSKIEAEIEFLSREEWKNELDSLLGDLKDTDDGRVKQYLDPGSEDAAVAREKIQAVYPTITDEALSRMTTNDLLLRNSALTLLFGHTARIVADDSSMFSQELSRYLNQEESQSLPPEVQRGDGHRRIVEFYWPLIRRVTIRSPSPVLSSGAVLVDLPGSADSNAARCRISQDYLRRASRFVIVAPITRAVSEKVARDLCGEAFRTQLKMDGKYNPNAITFVATKCDDLSCDEIIRSMKLTHNSTLRSIEMDIKTSTTDTQGWEQAADNMAKNIDDLERKMGAETERQVSRYSEDPVSTSTRALDTVIPPIVTPQSPSESKRKSVLRENAPPSKRRKHSSEQAHEPIDADDSRPLADGEPEDDEPDLPTLREQHRMALTSINLSKDKLRAAIKKRSAFCAKQRSEWSKKRLQADFKVGLEQYEDEDSGFSYDDDATADFELPVFACSSREYMHLIGRAGDDGRPATFSDVDETGIPTLGSWIQELTLSSREKTAEELLSHLQTLISSMRNFVEGMPRMKAEDSQALRQQWRSKEKHAPLMVGLPDRERRIARYRDHPTGIIPRLVKSFEPIVDAIAHDLSSRRSRLQGKCPGGATMAARAAIKASDAFASSMHWRTYRATLRRKGAFKGVDLNVKLTMPFTRRLASSWSRLFKLDLATSLERAASVIISTLLKELVDSVPAYVRTHAKQLAESSLQEARAELKSVSAVVQKSLNEQQEQISRSLAPRIQTELADGYEKAAAEVGRGSVVRQKKIFRDHLETKKETMFTNLTTALEGQLAAVTQPISNTLDEALEKIAKKVEVHIAILWEGCSESDEDNKARVSALVLLNNSSAEIKRWNEARRLRDANARSSTSAGSKN